MVFEQYICNQMKKLLVWLNKHLELLFPVRANLGITCVALNKDSTRKKRRNDPKHWFQEIGRARVPRNLRWFLVRLNFIKSCQVQFLSLLYECTKCAKSSILFMYIGRYNRLPASSEYCTWTRRIPAVVGSSSKMMGFLALSSMMIYSCHSGVHSEYFSGNTKQWIGLWSPETLF